MAVASNQVSANAAANDAVTGVAGISTAPEGLSAVVPPAQPSSEPAPDAKKQVFAGNLAFATKEEDLMTVFQEAGKITSIQIITRGRRSLGYAFVTFSTEEEAQRAVSTLNKRVIAGRELNVEGAKPQEELAAAKEAKAAARKAKQAEAGVEGGKSKSRNKKKGARKPREDAGEEADAVVTNGETNGEGTKKKRNRRNKASKAAIANGEVPLEGESAAADGTDAPTTARKPRPARKGPPTGEPSTTLVFAANLSFDIDDDALRSAFEGLSVTSAHIARRRFGARRSKGFGFVEFASQADQQKAIEQFNGKDLGGRPLSLKAAIDGSKEQAEQEAKEEAQAAAVPSEIPLGN